MIIDPITVAAIVAITIGITQTIKNFIKVEGFGAWALTFLVSAGATATYLLQHGGFVLLPFIIYTLVVFGNASGLYKVATNGKQ